ncbi:hypothetical protein TSAR_007109 [Trichomalopsis sarcophagae]|uniref:Uncharacterized protein n=1 Tax=Trichomalopsis sarcophagae TaxID=543379 RepID=A0A232EX10_9HYME|nr:hypothetical protein TSAR_007109 [Trichomalopsis sarcophagae]
MVRTCIEEFEQPQFFQNLVTSMGRRLQQVIDNISIIKEPASTLEDSLVFQNRHIGTPISQVYLPQSSSNFHERQSKYSRKTCYYFGFVYLVFSIYKVLEVGVQGLI